VTGTVALIPTEAGTTLHLFLADLQVIEEIDCLLVSLFPLLACPFILLDIMNERVRPERLLAFLHLIPALLPAPVRKAIRRRVVDVDLLLTVPLDNLSKHGLVGLAAFIDAG